jgi:biotin synthase-like enzyme
MRLRLNINEIVQDRLGLLQVLSNMDPHPESVPINALGV